MAPDGRLDKIATEHADEDDSADGANSNDGSDVDTEQSSRRRKITEEPPPGGVAAEAPHDAPQTDAGQAAQQ